MFKLALQELRSALVLIVLFSILTGLIYPLGITAIAQIFFPWRANGSLIESNDKYIVSQLIGQDFSNSNYFWGRPSATSAHPYNAMASGGSNLGPSNADFLALVKTRADALIKANLNNHFPHVPVELVTASGSGLDPDISPLAAFYQVHRIAEARGIPDAKITELINNSITMRSLGILGEPRVNVLELNIALDKMQ